MKHNQKPHAYLALAVALLVACQPIEYEDPADPAAEPSEPDALGEKKQAVTATGAAADSIRIVKGYTIDSGLRSAYFARTLQATPQRTPDGRGAFQFFHGDGGPGAIYFHEYDTSAGRASATFPVYGAILSAWAGWGYETLLGYPNSEEESASDRSERTPCATQGGIRQQLFGYVHWDDADGGGTSEVVLCWSPDRGVWALPLEVAQGLGALRYIERVPDLP